MGMISQSMAESRSMGKMERHLMMEGWRVVEVADREGLLRFRYVTSLLVLKTVRFKPTEDMVVQFMMEVVSFSHSP